MDTIPSALRPAADVVRHTRASAQAFATELHARGTEFVRFEMADMAGLSRGKTVPISQVETYVRDGLNLYGGMVALDSASMPVPGSGYHEEVNFSDGLMIADPDTVSPVPWLTNTVRVICDTVWRDGRPQEAAPRMVLKRVLAASAAMGFGVKMGHEYEFYVVDAATRQPIYGGQPIFVTSATHRRPEMERLTRILQQSGVDMIIMNAEHGPGQWELNFEALDGVAAADRAFVFKNTVKEYLWTEGLLATFMTKPYKGLSGSCSHFHLSLFDLESKRNVFLDAADPNGMSGTMRSFVQGILDHARAAQAMWNPTTNCYRRIRPALFAPTAIAWGVEDRTGAVRVKASKDHRQHLEVRVPSALSNPYLVAAATIASGLLGVRANSALPPQATGPKETDPSLPKLPTEMHEALASLLEDAALTEMLGSEVVRVFSLMKGQEMARLRDEIPPAETAEYFELY